MKINKNKVTGWSSLLLGLFIINISLIMNSSEQWLINTIINSLSTGADPLYFQNYANGLMAGGSIRVIPYFVVIITAIIGCLISYYGTYVIINHKSPNARTGMFNKAYWKEYQAKLAYREKRTTKPNYINKKKREMAEGPIHKKGK